MTTPLKALQPGDMIFAKTLIVNDGSLPGVPENQLIARPGTRGMLVNTGHLEENPEQEIHLVRFENEQKDLGLAVSCWPEELSADPVNSEGP